MTGKVVDSSHFQKLHGISFLVVEAEGAFEFCLFANTNRGFADSVRCIPVFSVTLLTSISNAHILHETHV